MNAERLLAHFETISEAPDAIARLRRFILDLVVRGKLVEQDPEDEDKRVHSKLIDSADKSFSLIPASWLYVPLASLLDEDTRNGYSRKPDDAEDGFPILRISAGTARPDGLVDEREFKLISGIDEDLASQYAVEKGDLLACRFNGNKAYVGRVSLFTGYSGRKFIYPDKLIRIRLSDWLAEPSFFRWISNSDLVRKEVENRCATTVGNWGISAGKLKTCMFPLPPLAEQHRIVAKVDELMALCDQLEAARQERQQGRERLVVATLQRLSQPAEDPASFRRDARFALQVLPSLTTTPAQIKQLRQTILNLAVRGKLVEQDPEDEPAHHTLRVVRLQKQILRVEKRIRNKQRTPVLGGSPPFCIPNGWEWLPFGELHWVVRGVTYTKADVSDVAQGGYVPVLRAGNIGYRLTFDDPVFVREGCISDDQYLRAGDFLVALSSGSKRLVGKAARVGVVPTHAFGGFCGVIRLVDAEHCDFVAVYLRSSLYREAIAQGSRGLGINNLKIEVLANAFFPLPPLAEQHRIVAKVDELMALCDQLEQQLSQADQQRRLMLEAMLTEALLEPEKMLEVAYD